MTHSEGPSVPPPASTWWHWGLLLVLLPSTLTVALPDWRYSAADSIDAWVYNGFFRHLSTYSSVMFPGTYYGSRLGWIVPGAVAYQLFQAQTAAFVLHVVFYDMAIGSLYWIVRRIAGPSSAVFAALACGFYLPAVRALGSDYVDGAVIAYALLSVALGMSAPEKTRPWAIFGSGMAAGAMLNSNIGAAFLLPSMLVWFVPLTLRGWLTKSLWTQAAIWTGGIVGCTLALSIVSVVAGGSWAFFLQSFRWIQGQQFKNPWDVAGLTWILASPWVFLPLATMLAILIAWRPWTRIRPETGRIRAGASLGILLAVFIVWDFIGSGSLLFWPFYASWLVPWTFIAIGAVLLPAGLRPGLEAAVLAVATLMLAVSVRSLRYWHIPGFGIDAFVITILLVLVTPFVRQAVAARLTIATVVMCLNGWLELSDYYYPKADRVANFAIVDRGVTIVDRYLTEHQPRFLLASPQKLALSVQSLTSVYLWGYTIVSPNYPKVTSAQAALIVPGTTVIVIAEYADAASSFDSVFAPFGLQGIRKASERIETKQGPLYLTFLEAKARAVS